jgi:hypothetical protein
MEHSEFGPVLKPNQNPISERYLPFKLTTPKFFLTLAAIATGFISRPINVNVRLG